MSRGYSQVMYYARAALLFALIAVILSACGAKADSPDDAELDAALLTPVAAAQESGMRVYWLGRSFEAGGVVFDTREARFPEGIAGAPVKGLEIDYSSGDQPRGGIVELEVLPREEWAMVEDKITNPRVAGLSRRAVALAGTSAELFAAPGATRPLNALWLVLDLGDAVVVAETQSGGPAYPDGPDYNPFINNPALFVQVIDENLRPYPE